MTSAWEVLFPRHNVLICIAHRGIITVEFKERLSQMLKPEGTNIFYGRGTPLPEQRTLLAREALKGEYDWLLFLDSDTIPPQNGLLNLLSHNLPIVSGWVRAKQKTGFVISGWMKYKNGVLPIDEKQEQRLVKVDYIANAFSLIHTSVFKKIPEPWFKWTRDIIEHGTSEDFFFCDRAKEYGYDIIIDMETKCEHIGLLKIKPNGSVTTLDY